MKSPLVFLRSGLSLIPVVALVLLSQCTTRPATTDSKSTVDSTITVNEIKVVPFGKLKDGTAVSLYTLRNKNGVEMKVMNYGGIIVSLSVPDKAGAIEDVTLGYDSLSQYERSNPYFGALIGRYGNRIAKGKFVLDGKAYTLATNDGPNHLHGGLKGFDKVFWSVEPATDKQALKLTYKSQDGEEGYPGNLSVEVVYTLTDDNELKIAYHATTDKKTIINLTQHTYFNLSGNTKRDILGHELEIASDRFLPVDGTLIPTGELKKVAGTPFDFNTSTVIGKRINEKDEQLKLGKGYDHCWIITDTTKTLRKVATLYDPISGRVMETFTTEPAIQFYSGNFLTSKNIGKGGVVNDYRTAACLESEHYPDSPNQAKFPSVVLSPGQQYVTTTVYKFSTK